MARIVSASCTGSGGAGICGPCKKIEELDVRIFEVEKHLASLKAERVVLNTSRNALHDPIVRRLPLEIISRIFQVYGDMHYDDDDDDDDEDKSFPFLPRRMEEAPLRLGAVCHAWRAIAWASPRLWTKMAVDYSRRGHEAVPEIALQWLERTGELPLSISLFEKSWWNWEDDYSGAYKDTDMARLLSLLRTTCKFSSRWRTLDIKFPPLTIYPPKELHYSSPGIHGRGSSLQYLQLDVPSDFTAPLFEYIYPKASPTYISLVDTQFSLVDINWSNATTISAGRLTFQECFQVLQASVGLQNFTFHISEDPDPTHFPSSPITIPTLRFLDLRYGSTSILDFIVLPLLDELHLSQRYVTIACLISLVRRSHCQLKTLEFRNSSITDELLSFFQSTVSLESFTFSDYSTEGNAESLFKYLATSDESVDLPNLEQLQFTTDLQEPFLWETIPDIYDPERSYTGHRVVSSASPRLQRRSLSLLLDMKGDPDEVGYIDVTSLHCLSDLIEEGIHISLRFRDTREKSNEPEDFIATSLAFHYLSEESSSESESE